MDKLIQKILIIGRLKLTQLAKNLGRVFYQPYNASPQSILGGSGKGIRQGSLGGSLI